MVKSGVRTYQDLAAKTDKFQAERDIFLDHIKTAGLRRTPQRELILETFLGNEEHMTSEALYDRVRSKDPAVGLTTVYRTLRLLVESGLAREVRFGDTATYYEHHYNHEHHDHMICTGCGTILEFFSPELEATQDKMADKFDFLPTHHSLRIWGLCSKCQKARKGGVTAPSGAQPRVKIKTAM